MRFQLIRTYQGHQDTICALAPVPGQPRFVSASHDGLIKIWNLRSDTSLTLRQKTDSHPTALAIFPTGYFMATGLSDGQLEIWNLESSEIVRHLNGHEHSVTALAITHGGSTLVSGSEDCTVRIWNAITGALQHICNDHRTGIKTLAVTPDDKLVLAGEHGDQEIPGISKAWQIATGTAAAEFNDMPEKRQYMAVLRDGKHVVSGSEDGEIVTWDRETGEKSQMTIEPGPLVMSLMPDQRTMVIGTPKPGLALWDLDTGEKIYQFDEPSAEVVSIAVMNDARYVIAGCQDGSLNFYMRVS